MLFKMHVGSRLSAVYGVTFNHLSVCDRVRVTRSKASKQQHHLPRKTRAQVVGTSNEPQVSASQNQPSAMPPFHLAFPVSDLDQTRSFYGGLLGCPEGRSAAGWIDYNMFGHQIVCHQVKGYNANASANAVDGDPVPVPHFGLALSVQQFHDLADRVKQADVKFVIQPHLRFKGQPGEQWTMFFKDPSGNALEFKAMTIPDNLFAKYYVS